MSPGAEYVPLTGKERWTLYSKRRTALHSGLFSPVFSSLVLDQARGEPKEWGGGWADTRAAASRTGSGVIQGTVQATAAAVLREDVRYIGSSQRGAGRRVLHALV